MIKELSKIFSKRITNFIVLYVETLHNGIIGILNMLKKNNLKNIIKQLLVFHQDMIKLMVIMFCKVYKMFIYVQNVSIEKKKINKI